MVDRFGARRGARRREHHVRRRGRDGPVLIESADDEAYGALAGGERQRVAVVRAVTAAVCLGPGTLVLLDEPFTGLDLWLRDELLGRLQPWLG
jgi:ABC-type molybdenum transport system ATPase subunit/photorepair protein PhrA